jgi:hypothetical protein
MLFMDNTNNLYYTGLFNAADNSCSNTKKILMSDLSGNVSITGSLKCSSSISTDSGVKCTYIVSSGEVNLTGDYIKTGKLWLEYSNRLTLSGNREEDYLAINFSCWKTGEGDVAKGTHIFDGCYNRIAAFDPDAITLYQNTEIKGSLTVPSLTAQSFSTNSFNASSLSVGNVSILDSCVSVGDVHVYNEDLSYSDLVGSI